MLNRISISDLKREGLLKPGAYGSLSFADGSFAKVRCVSDSELVIGYNGNEQAISYITVAQHLGNRVFFVDGQHNRATHLYYVEGQGFLSRQQAGLHYRGSRAIPRLKSVERLVSNGRVER